MRLPTAYYSIMAPFSVLSFNWLEAILPTACIGGFPQKLRVQVLAPLVITEELLDSGLDTLETSVREALSPTLVVAAE